MTLFLQFALLAAGLILIWKTGEAAVRNAVAFSLAYNVEKFAIGFYIFSLSTCLPEISAVIASSLQKVPELSAGNLMGSTLANVSLVLGIAAIMAKNINIEGSLKKTILRFIWLIVIILASISITGKANTFAGILLILIYFSSLFWFQMGIPKDEAVKEIIQIEKKPVLSSKMSIILKLIFSLFLLAISSWLIVYSSKKIANILHIDLSMFGATLISVGTSFSEITLIIHSVKKKEYSLALGDIFGASVVNLSLALGILIMLNSGIDLTYARKVLPFLIICVALVILRLYQNKPIVRKDGIIFIGSFVLYTFVVFLPTMLNKLK